MAGIVPASRVQSAESQTRYLAGFSYQAYITDTYALGTLHADMVKPAGGGVKDVPFFPYAPYIPQTEMSVTGASFSQKRVQLPPVEEEGEREEGEERVEDNERVCRLCACCTHTPPPPHGPHHVSLVHAGQAWYTQLPAVLVTQSGMHTWNMYASKCLIHCLLSRHLSHSF